MHGQGPGEFSSPQGFYPVDGKASAAWLHDFSNRRLSLVEVGTDGSEVISEEIALRVNTTLENPTWMGDTGQPPQ